MRKVKHTSKSRAKIPVKAPPPQKQPVDKKIVDKKIVNKDDPSYDPGNVKKTALEWKYGQNAPTPPNPVTDWKEGTNPEYFEKLTEFENQVDAAITEFREFLKSSETEFKEWQDALPKDMADEISQHHKEEKSKKASNLKETLKPKIIGAGVTKPSTSNKARRMPGLGGVAEKIAGSEKKPEAEEDTDDLLTKMLKTLLSIDKKLGGTPTRGRPVLDRKAATTSLPISDQISKNLSGGERLAYEISRNLAKKTKERVSTVIQNRKEQKEKKAFEARGGLTDTSKDLIDRGLMTGRGAERAAETRVEPAGSATPKSLIEEGSNPPPTPEQPPQEDSGGMFSGLASLLTSFLPTKGPTPTKIPVPPTKIPTPNATIPKASMLGKFGRVAGKVATGAGMLGTVADLGSGLYDLSQGETQKEMPTGLDILSPMKWGMFGGEKIRQTGMNEKGDGWLDKTGNFLGNMATGRGFSTEDPSKLIDDVKKDRAGKLNQNEEQLEDAKKNNEESKHQQIVDASNNSRSTVVQNNGGGEGSKGGTRNQDTSFIRYLDSRADFS